MIQARWLCFFLFGMLFFSGVTRAGDAQLSQEEVGKRLGVTTENVHKVQSIQVDHQEVGVLVSFRKGTGESVALISAGGEVVSLGRVGQVDILGVIDLDSARKIPTTLKNPSALSRRGMTRPLLVLRSRKAIFPPLPISSVQKKQFQRPPTVGSVEVLFLFLLRDGFTPILRLETEKRSVDGFGGHSIAGLHFVNTKEGVVLEGERQRKLPARRARALRPAKEKLRFLLGPSGFRKQSSVAP